MDLFKEGETIQKKFNSGIRHDKKSDLLNSFTHNMFEGKVRPALRILDESQSKSGQPLSLSNPLSSDDPSCGTVHDALLMKHPDPSHVVLSMSLVQVTPPPDHDPHIVAFDQIDGLLIRQTILKMDGAAGPSGMDASSWKKVCSSFVGESEDLCESIACVARKLCTCYVDPNSIDALVAGRLIALDKNPGVRPIGVGKVCRRLIGKAILSVIRSEVLEITGCLQLCAGQSSACEAIIHAVRHLYNEAGDDDGLLFIDASNAFNALNRGLALRNILYLCPSLGRVLINMYRTDTSLFIDGVTLFSKEGTTQGDPLAMAMFAVATVPLIKELSSRVSVKQLWYADDATSLGSLLEIRRWWDYINRGIILTSSVKLMAIFLTLRRPPCW